MYRCVLLYVLMLCSRVYQYIIGMRTLWYHMALRTHALVLLFWYTPYALSTSFVEYLDCCTAPNGELHVHLSKNKILRAMSPAASTQPLCHKHAQSPPVSITLWISGEHLKTRACWWGRYLRALDCSSTTRTHSQLYRFRRCVLV